MKYSKHLPEGWQKAIGTELDKRLEDFVAKGGTIVQVKEKFGDLRVYVGTYPEGSNLSLSDLDEKCSNSCMVCGEPGTMTTIRGWIGPRCEEHKE